MTRTPSKKDSGPRVRITSARPTRGTNVTAQLTLDLDLPGDLARFRLPEAVNARLQSLLDRQDGGTPFSADERSEAEGLVNLAELLTYLRLRAERAG